MPKAPTLTPEAAASAIAVIAEQAGIIAITYTPTNVEELYTEVVNGFSEYTAEPSDIARRVTTSTSWHRIKTAAEDAGTQQLRDSIEAVLDHTDLAHDPDANRVHLNAYQPTRHHRRRPPMSDITSILTIETDWPSRITQMLRDMNGHGTMRVHVLGEHTTHGGTAFEWDEDTPPLPMAPTDAKKLADDTGRIELLVLIDKDAYLSGHARAMQGALDGTHEDLAHDAAFTFGTPEDAATEIVGVTSDAFVVRYSTDLSGHLPDGGHFAGATVSLTVSESLTHTVELRLDEELIDRIEQAGCDPRTAAGLLEFFQQHIAEDDPVLIDQLSDGTVSAVHDRSVTGADTSGAPQTA